MPWQVAAACRGMSDRVFFPSVDTGVLSSRMAKSVCALCRVRVECLADAMQAERSSKFNRHGIRGGLSPRERSAMADYGTPGRRAKDADDRAG